MKVFALRVLFWIVGGVIDILSLVREGAQSLLMRSSRFHIRLEQEIWREGQSVEIRRKLSRHWFSGAKK